jgi:hypothetical protein
MTMLEIWSFGFGAVTLCLILLWRYSLQIKNASIIDIFWGVGFALLAFTYNLLSVDGYGPRKTILTGLVTIWGLRLALHIYWRNVGHGEDFRYRKWREEAGPAWWLFLRGPWRLATGLFQGKSRQQRSSAQHRPLALHSPPQLFWRRLSVVGLLCFCLEYGRILEYL